MSQNHISAMIPGYTLLSWIGHGTFGHIFYVEHDASKVRAAAKVFRWNHRPEWNEEMKRQIEAECCVASWARHGNVLTVDPHPVRWDGGLALLTQYCGGGDLMMLLQRMEGRGDLAEVDVSFVCARVLDIVDALVYFHDHGWVHHDVKCENVYLDTAMKRAFLGDFGLVCRNHTPYGPSGPRGTLSLLPPSVQQRTVHQVTPYVDQYGVFLMLRDVFRTVRHMHTLSSDERAVLELLRAPAYSLQTVQHHAWSACVKACDATYVVPPLMHKKSEQARVQPPDP